MPIPVGVSAALVMRRPGLVAVARFDLVAAVFGLDFGQTNAATRIIYGLVGLSALYQVTQLRALPGRWASRRHAMAA